MHAVDILAARCAVIVGHVYQPPLQPVGAAQDIRLPWSPHYFGVGGCVSHIEKLDVYIAAPAPFGLGLDCNEVVATDDCFCLLACEIYDVVAASFAVADLFAVDIDPCVAVVCEPQGIVVFAVGYAEVFAQPYARGIPKCALTVCCRAFDEPVGEAS